MPRKMIISTKIRRWAIAGFVVVLMAGGAAAYTVQHHNEAALLRADPDTLPDNPSLMAFAWDHGEAIYQSNCASCHGAEGKGDPSRGVPNLTDNDWLYGSGHISEIEKVVDYGIRAGNPKTWDLAQMPAYARALPSASEPRIPPLSPGDIRDVVEFLRLTERRPADQAAATRGAEIYLGRGGCYDCHAPDAQGDNAIGAPNLSDNIWLYGDGSRQSLFNTIAYGHAGVCPSWFGKLGAASVREVAAYVWGLSHHTTLAMNTGKGG